MKIIRCYIENFGKLSNFTYEFETGINNIFEDNGFGKTTLANFIKAMFYGLEYKRSKSLYERKKYLPWNEQKCGGNLVFKTNGKTYKIVRTFGQKPSDDTFVLYDEQTNLVSNDFSINIGEELFKVDKTSFENTCFIDLSNTNQLLTQIISSKLENNNAQDRFDEFEKAYNALQNKATALLSKRGNKGTIPESRAKLNAHQRKLLECNLMEKEITKTKDSIKQINADIISLEKEIDNVIKTQQVSKNTVTLEYLNAMFENYNKSQLLQYEIRDLEQEYKNQKNEQQARQKEMAVTKIMFALACIVGIIGIIFFSAQSLISIAVLICVGVMIAFCSVKMVLIKRKMNKKFYDVKEQISELKLKKDVLDDTYKEFIIKHNPYDNLNDILNSLTKIKNKIKNDSVDGYANKSHKNLVESLSHLKSQKIICKDKIKNLSEKLTEKDEILSNIEVLSQKIKNYNNQYIIYTETMKYLQKARENLQARYIDTLENSFYKYLKLFDIKDENNYKIDVNLKVSIEKYGQLFESDYLSAGYKDLIAFVIRLSLIDAIYKESDRPVIILDDCFVNLDEDKIIEAKKILKEISKKYQIIYFTCHNSRQIA